MAFKRFLGMDAPSPKEAVPEGLTQRLVNELSRNTKFDVGTVEQLGELYYNVADSNGLIDKARFVERLGLTHARKLLFADRLFEGFLRGRKDGKINFSDWVIGLNAMSRAPEEERTKFCFKLYDLSNADNISRSDLRAVTESTIDSALTIADMFTAQLAARTQNAQRIEFESKLHGRGQVLNVTKTDAPQSEVRHGKRLSAFPPDEAIQKIVEKVFEEVDLNRDGKISLKEFRAWCSKDPGVLDVLTFYARMLTSIDPLATVIQKEK